MWYDEKDAECLNCIKSKRVCEGYRPKFEFRDGLNNNTKIGKLVNGMVQQQGQQGQPHHHSHSSMHHHHNYYQQNDMPYPQKHMDCIFCAFPPCAPPQSCLSRSLPFKYGSTYLCTKLNTLFEPTHEGR